MPSESLKDRVARFISEERRKSDEYRRLLIAVRHRDDFRVLCDLAEAALLTATDAANLEAQARRAEQEARVVADEAPALEARWAELDAAGKAAAAEVENAPTPAAHDAAEKRLAAIRREKAGLTIQLARVRDARAALAAAKESGLLD